MWFNLCETDYSGPNLGSIWTGVFEQLGKTGGGGKLPLHSKLTYFKSEDDETLYGYTMSKVFSN